MDKSTHPAQWPLANNAVTHPRTDGYPRVVDLKVAKKSDSSSKKGTSDLQRPVSKIILMVPSEIE